MRKGFTLLELIIAAAILGGVMTTISMSLRNAGKTAAAIEVRGDLNTQAWTAVRTIADGVRNGQVTSFNTTSGILIYKPITDLSGSTVTYGANSTTVTTVSVTQGGQTIKKLQTTGLLYECRCSRKQIRLASTNGLYPKTCRGLTAPSYPGFLVAQVGNMVIIGVTLEQQDPSGAKNADGTPSKYRASALTQVMLRNF